MAPSRKNEFARRAGEGAGAQEMPAELSNV